MTLLSYVMSGGFQNKNVTEITELGMVLFLFFWPALFIFRINNNWYIWWFVKININI